MNTISKYIALILLVTCSGNVRAQIVNYDEAAGIACSFFEASTSCRHKIGTKEGIRLAYTSYSSDVPDFYIFNNKGTESGFVIVNADAYGDQILAFSTTNCFDADSIPDNVRYLLSTYKNHTAMPGRRKAYSSVREMITTKWTQRAPYNSEIPLISPSYTGDYALSVGCSSIATSQIMKYYNYPAHGTGSNSFQINWRSSGLKTYSADFEKTYYDWDNIIDDYSNGYTEEQRSAVGTLVYHVTVAENTHYGQIIGSGSANNNGDAGVALTKYFGYDKGIRRCQRKYYDDESWFNLINEELEAQRPVFFLGKTSAGVGHAFIIHGYDADNDLYAINWGWGGLYDGYYSLAGANPLPSYRTDTSYAYSNEQEITIGIQPDAGGQYVPQIGTYDDYSLVDLSYGETDCISIDRSTQNDMTVSLRIRYMNYGVGTHSFDRGVKLCDGNAEYIIPITSGSAFEPDEYNTFPVSLSFDTSKILSDGSFQVLPVIRIPGGEWIEVLRNPSQSIPRIEVMNTPQTNCIADINADINNTIYNVNGTRINVPSHGINIVRKKDGKTKKIISRRK